jgi:hypothetical protein
MGEDGKRTGPSRGLGRQSDEVIRIKWTVCEKRTKRLATLPIHTHASYNLHENDAMGVPNQFCIVERVRFIVAVFYN